MTHLVSTGVEGLDSILSGGLTERSTVLVSGNPGTGKSIFGIQYLYTGAIRAAATAVGFEGFEDLVDDGEIVVLDKREMLRETDFSTAVDRLLETVEGGEFDRLVLDSLSMFQLFFEDEHQKRTYLLKFSDILKANGLTSLLIAEQGAVFPDTEVGLENFLTDGNVYFIQTPTESGVTRYVWVAKMRKQDIDTDIFPMEIGQGGITVHERAGGFSMMSQSDGPSF
jgi:KaiC/GvpD/RAD55 family RecA-like ATPase